VRYNECDRCGCPSGFNGQQCQCRTSTGSIRLHGYSDILVSFQQLKDQIVKNSLAIPDLYYELKDNALFLTSSLLQEFSTTLGLDLKSLSVSIEHKDVDNTNKPDEVAHNTVFSFKIQINCDSYSPSTTLQQLTDRWSVLGKDILKYPIIQKYFIFAENDDEPVVVPSELVPIDDTLPTPDQAYQEPNYAETAQIGSIMLLSTLYFIFTLY
jgi:hypothetical protein